MSHFTGKVNDFYTHSVSNILGVTGMVISLAQKPGAVLTPVIQLLGKRDQKGFSLRPTLAKKSKTPSQKINQAWSPIPIISATQECK
jgi:hypothetical protein